MFYKNFVKNAFQHSTKFLIVLSLASFLAACGSSGGGGSAPAKKTNNVPMPTGEITLTEALKKTASTGDFAINPDMNDLQAATNDMIDDCTAVDTATNFPIKELKTVEDLKLALGRISSGLSQCEKFITDSITTLVADVKDATLGIGTDVSKEVGGRFYSGMVNNASNGVLNVTNLSADNPESGHWSWQASTDSTASLVMYVDSKSNTYAIAKQESAGKGVFKIYCKVNSEFIAFCLQYRYSAAAGDFDANTSHGTSARTNLTSHYFGNLKAQHAYAIDPNPNTAAQYYLSSAKLTEPLGLGEHTGYGYGGFDQMNQLLSALGPLDLTNRQDFLQKATFKKQATNIQNALDYDAQATFETDIAKAYEGL